MENKCSFCNGEGTVECDCQIDLGVEECPECNGIGYNICHNCNGTGEE